MVIPSINSIRFCSNLFTICISNSISEGDSNLPSSKLESGKHYYQVLKNGYPNSQSIWSFTLVRQKSQKLISSTSIETYAFVLSLDATEELALSTTISKIVSVLLYLRILPSSFSTSLLLRFLATFESDPRLLIDEPLLRLLDLLIVSPGDV